MSNDLTLFHNLGCSRDYPSHETARLLARGAGALLEPQQRFESHVDEYMLEVFERAKNPDDADELRDLWLGRVEAERGRRTHRPWLAEKWRNSARRRSVTSDEVLRSRATVRFVKGMFNWFFQHDLYGDLREQASIILSGGSVDEVAWGLPEALKECIRYALARDWYGYSDSRGRVPAREAVARYETVRMAGGAQYGAENVALTMGGTFAVSSIADFVSQTRPHSRSAVLCATPNYPPLVESIARRTEVQLVPLISQAGSTCLGPLIAALTADTPMVLLQTVCNPTGAVVPEAELERLVAAASPNTLIVLDECHEWLGADRLYSSARAAPNVVRVSSVSKTWSAPGLKVGWLLADASFIDAYYEYASTTFGGPPSFFYTFVEVLARLERWMLEGISTPGESERREFESSYALDLTRLQLAYESYRQERVERDHALHTLRDASIVGFIEAGARVVTPRYSINVALELNAWNDSYQCFRDLLDHTGVAVLPGLLTFCMSRSTVRVTTARPWESLAAALDRVGPYLRERACLSQRTTPTGTDG